MPTQLSALGLFTSVNEAEAPEGSLIRAENCVIRNKDIIEPRRGFKAYDYGFGTSGSRTKQGFFYQDKAHVQYGTTLAYDTGSAFADYAGSFTGADETLMRMKYQVFRNNLYLATTTGIRKIPDAGNAPRDAGVPQSLGYAYYETPNLSTGNPSPGIYKLATGGGGFVTVSNPDYAGAFSVNEKIFCTSSDANFASGVKTVTATDGVSFKYTDPAGSPTGSAVNAIWYSSVPIIDSAGFLADGYQCAYRFVLDIPDNNHQILLGPPSDRFVVQNSSSTIGYVAGQSKNVQLRIGLPANLPNGTRLWIYRTEQTTISPNIPPSEEMYKVYERLLAPADLTKKVVVIKDIVPDIQLEDLLYTSPVAEGIINANFKPPQAKDVASWNNRMWYSNTKTTYSLTIRLLGLPTGNDKVFGIGDANGVYVYLGAEYTHGGTWTQDKTFYVDTSGSTAQNIEATSRNLVAAINNCQIDTITAYYESSLDDPPGIIRIESTIPVHAFYLTYNSPLAQRAVFDPILPYQGSANAETIIGTFTRSNNVVTVSPTTPSGINNWLAGEKFTLQSTFGTFTAGTYEITSATDSTFTYAHTGIDITTTNITAYYAGPYTPGDLTREEVVNRVYFSKLQQGEAVPLLNYMDVGSPGKQILRICPLRERLYVFKEDGIYTIAGEYPYRVDLVDDTSWLIAADTVALTGNQIFCLTNQGVVSVAEPGVSIVSRPVETDIFRYVQDARNNNLLKSCVGIGYNSDRNYLIGFATATEWYASPIYVYNYLNKVWTTWDKICSWGAVHLTQDKLYLGGVRFDNYLSLERKTSERRCIDYADEMYKTTISSVNETAKTMVVVSATNISVGDMLYSGSTPEPPSNSNGFAMGLVTAVNGTTISFDYIYSASDVGYFNFTNYVSSVDALKIYKKYEVMFMYATITAGDATLLKQFQEISPIFGVRCFKNMSVEFYSNASYDMVPSNTVSASPLFSDGRFNKLTMDNIVPISKRIVVPRAQQQATNLTVRFTISEAMSYWRLLGFGIQVNPISNLANRTR